MKNLAIQTKPSNFVNVLFISLHWVVRFNFRRLRWNRESKTLLLSIMKAIFEEKNILTLNRARPFQKGHFQCGFWFSWKVTLVKMSYFCEHPKDPVGFFSKSNFFAFQPALIWMHTWTYYVLQKGVGVQDWSKPAYVILEQTLRVMP